MGTMIYHTLTVSVLAMCFLRADAATWHTSQDKFGIPGQFTSELDSAGSDFQPVPENMISALEYAWSQNGKNATFDIDYVLYSLDFAKGTVTSSEGGTRYLFRDQHPA